MRSEIVLVGSQATLEIETSVREAAGKMGHPSRRAGPSTLQELLKDPNPELWVPAIVCFENNRWVDFAVGELRRKFRTAIAIDALTGDPVLTLNDRFSELALFPSPTLSDVVRKTILYQFEKLNDNLLGLDELVHHAAVSQTLLEESFGRTGIPVMKNLAAMRMRQARRLVEETEMQIAEIALNVGITDPDYLSRRFKRAYGVSPMQYRRAHRE